VEEARQRCIYRPPSRTHGRPADTAASFLLPLLAAFQIGLATAAFSVGVSALSQEFGVADVVGQVGMLVPQVKPKDAEIKAWRSVCMAG
jgi:hypothetical protein